jgi:multimeric flavodoxin WrbA
MKIVAINGSPRAKKGMTDQVLGRFLKGAEEGGAEIETIYLAKLEINPCIACLHCWFRTPGVCRHDDDMPGLMKSLGSADLLVFACPVYVDGMTGQMKTMFDRFLSYAEPFFVFEGGRSYHPRLREDDVPVVVISTCGFPERENFQAISLHFRRIFENMHAALLAEFLFPASSLIASDPDIVEPNLCAVERAGREVAETGAVPPETVEVANLDYVGDPAAFDEKMNEVFHALRRHHGAE